MQEKDSQVSNYRRMEKTRILLDTDIGSDIDDAVALAYLLKHPGCELLGITTVSGEPEKRAALADAVCQASGRTDIPIHVGTGKPMLVPQKQPLSPQSAALTDRWPHRTFAANEASAVAFLRDTILANPGEITLFAIGPLTNIGLLFAMDPTIPAKIKRLVIMGGNFFKDSVHTYAEWNIICDPHAAEIVFQSDVPELLAVGLDVTLQCILDADECRRRFELAGGALELVSSMAEVWFRHSKQITFHDPLAAAVMFNEAICTYEDHHVDVELKDPDTLGATIPASSDKGKMHRLARTVDSDAFFKHYFEVVGG